MKTAKFIGNLVLAAVFGSIISGPASAQEDSVITSIVEMWLDSGHADARSEAFQHWNEDGEIPANCAVCHSSTGFRDFHGLDGSAAGTVDMAAPVGGVIGCETCHAEGAMSIAELTFPSGVTITDMGQNAMCMTCHQGRESGLSVVSAVAELPADESSEELSFINPHYNIAASTQLGAEVKGGYEYDGKTYMGRFNHVPTFAQCTDCHDAHTLKVKVAECVACHQTDDPALIRISTTDFDGDGDVSEGMAAEVNSLHSALYDTMLAYADAVLGAPILYDDHTYPYFFNDTNGNGAVDEGEASYANSYKSWSPRLLKAAYNFQFVGKDPGAYAHNPHYAMQIMFDSIEDLISVTDGADMPAVMRP